ncbi:major facilitator superfamily domain-containing protein [Sphaerosporella brunnea]|uniref:Major facilitator superfamily domain-containing protein n=1 Tax=Sphaerosporella brunnea TaxID=1250544 RepID=A0A5J5F8Z6_9PEZI|nr:major facilitator superfamily domain-containing protein [Sphaerosporella brunnea]
MSMSTEKEIEKQTDADIDSSSSAAVTSEFEQKLVRKLDLHIVPVVMLLYLLSFLDRVNIGSARLYGLEEDLGLKGNQYQLAVSILFVTYIIFEIPGNLVLKKVTPRYFISGITVAWGIIATLTGIVQSFGGLIACRLLLGAVEAGLFPGLAIYLTFFYTKSELALRIGYLFVSAALAGACGGLLAYAIGHMDGTSGQRGWRWILIIEGLPTLLMGIVTFFVFADEPETAWYLTPEERAFCITRLEREAENTASARQFHWTDVKKAFTDWTVYAYSCGQFGEDTILYGYSTFLPTIIKNIGNGAWSNARVQALTIPCYALGAITYLAVARASDAHQKRALYTIVFAAVSIVGYGILLAPASPGVHYFGCFLIATGLYVAVGLPLAWLPNNAPRYGKRAAASGLQLTFGNASGVMAPFLYPTHDGPRFIKGHAVSLSMGGMAALMYLLLWIVFARRNRQREKGLEDHKLDGKTPQEVAEMGDESPNYRYTI